MSEVQYGIYIGENNSCIAVNGKIITNKRVKNETVVPTMVAFQNEIKEPIVGMNIFSILIANPENTIYGFHELIGKKFSDIEVQEFRNNVKFKIEKKNENDEIKIVINHNKQLIEKPPESFIKIIIAQLLKFENNTYNNNTNFSYYLTIPSNFNDNQIKLIKNEIDSLKTRNNNEIKIIPESKALIFKDGNESIYDNIFLVLICDKTKVNISVLKYGELIGNKSHNFNIDSFKEKLLKYCINDCQKKIKDFVIKNDQEKKLKEKINNAITYLFEKPIYEIIIPNFDKHNTRFNIEITYNLLNVVCQDEYKAIINLIKSLLYELKLSIDRINKFVFSCNTIPNIPNYFSLSFPQIPENSILILDGKYENFAIGASLYQSEDENDGIDVYDDNESDNINVNDKDSPIILSLGFEKENGRMDFIFKKGENKNFKQNIHYETKYDYQDKFYLKIYRGERLFVEDNYLLGIFELSNLKKKKKGNIIIIENEFIPEKGKLEISIYEKDNPYNKKKFQRFPYVSKFTEKEEMLIKNPNIFQKEDESKLNVMYNINILKEQILKYDDILDALENQKPKLINEFKDSLNQIYSYINFKNYQEYKNKFDKYKLMIDETNSSLNGSENQKKLFDAEIQNKRLIKENNELNHRVKILQSTIIQIKGKK